MATPPAVGATIADSAAPADMWVIWQMVDSLYPTGGFAHSLGLEAAVQERLVTTSTSAAAAAVGTSTSLDQFLRTTLHQTGNLVLPIVFTMHTRARACTDPTLSSADAAAACVAAFVDVNAQTTALLTNHVAQKASLAQGAAMLRLALSTYTTYNSNRFAVLRAARQAAKQQQHPGVHHAVVFALVCALLNVDSDTTQRLALFVAMRDVLSAATRLNLVGPFEAARLQFEMRDVVERVFTKSRNRVIEDAYTSAPVLDLVQAMHDQLYTRIFTS